MGDTDDVLAVNRAFYQAFEDRDLSAMSGVWEHSDRVVCVHPGWRLLRGWGAVSASFFALFQNAQRLQFVLTDERVEIEGDAAWVSVDENLLDERVTGTVAALNVFARDRATGAWAMVAHHGSAVVEGEHPGTPGD